MDEIASHDSPERDSGGQQYCCHTASIQSEASTSGAQASLFSLERLQEAQRQLGLVETMPPESPLEQPFPFLNELGAELEGAGRVGDESPFYYHALRFLLVGDSDVGKNEILEKFTTHRLPLVNQKEVEFKTTMILLDGKRIKLQLWDTSGQGRFSTIIQSYSRGADGIILVFDITNRWSFESIGNWLKEVDEYASGVPRVLVGNRLHLEFRREVSKATAMQYAAKHRMSYMEVSHLADYNILETFIGLGRQVLNRIRLHSWHESRVLTLQELCCRTIVQKTTSYSIERLPLPASVKSNLKSYSLNPHSSSVVNCCAHKQHKCCLNLHSKKNRRSSSPHNLLETSSRHDKKCTVS